MAFDFYFAGSQCEEATQLMIDHNMNILKSYVNDKKKILELFEKKDQGWKGKLLIDNGAFTIHRKGGSVDIDEYISWLNDNDDHIDLAIALDSIPGKWGEKRTPEELKYSQDKTWENYLYMLERCKSPNKLLPVFHHGESFYCLERFLNHKIDGHPIEYMCISGNKQLTNKQREEFYKKCFAIIHASANPDIKIHCLGSATLSNARRYPFKSMDASSWIMTGANGGIMTDMGVIKMSKESQNDPDNIVNLSEDAKKFVHDQCEELGIKFEDLQDNYRQRVCMNVMYMFSRSQSTDYVGGRIKTNALF